MDEILEQVENLPRFSQLQEKIENKQSPILISGLSDVGKAEILSTIFGNKRLPNSGRQDVFRSLSDSFRTV